ncbi:AI-2E family transporter [Citreimonas salinaria]|uniref:Predicted PurR-regulated permease PerM n=1 Tax=Citreimonas salinaria TaxID=321339 RepID=A0A1H3J6W6_9RHOB|nr:AI-2E family transporter [Citreimonas salinaria]SDY35279.1 Predicted PurR-regulated permease PerM [Citreimonas salinaria]
MNKLLSDNAQRVMIAIIAAVATTAALYFARQILAPVVFGLVVGVVASPVAMWMRERGLPSVLSAAALLLSATTLLALAFMAIAPLISALALRLPKIMVEIRGWVEAVSAALRGIESISDQIEQTVGSATGTVGEQGAQAIPTVMDALWAAPDFGAQVLIFMGTLFFFTLTRDDLYKAAGASSDTLRRADRAVSRYFAAVTIINVGLGVTVGVAMAGIGVDYAILWGLVACIMNFVLYLGPLLVAVGLLAAGLVQFGGAYALLPPLTFLAINLTEAQFVTPAFVGQQLHMSPLFVFLAIVFGLWLWGPVGAIVALPVAVWLGAMHAGIDYSPPRRTKKPRYEKL